MNQDISISDEMPDEPIPRPRVHYPRAQPGSKTWSLTCDWGFCNERSVGWRYGGDSHEWLPVCSEHMGKH